MRNSTRVAVAVAGLLAVLVGGALPAQADDRVRAVTATDGTLKLAGVGDDDCETWPEAYAGSTAPAMTQLDLSYLDVSGEECVGVVLAVVGTHLARLQVDRRVDLSGGGWIESHESRDLGRGWDGMRLLVDTNADFSRTLDGYLFALGDNGTLYRYRFLGSTDGSGVGGLRAAGSYPGLGVLRTLAVGSVTSTLDTLVGTTTGGQLVQLRIPRTSAMTVTSSRLRERTWQGFEHLLSNWSGGASRCPVPSRLNLAGVDDETGRQTNYVVGPLAGASTSITAVGQPSVIPPHDGLTSSRFVFSNAC